MNEYFSRRRKEGVIEGDRVRDREGKREREEKREGKMGEKRGKEKKGGGRERDGPAGYSSLWQNPAVVITLLFMVTQTTFF